MDNSTAHPPVDRTIAALRERVSGWRSAGDTLAMVPTMGALHEGHLALVSAARELSRRVVVTIFVNPTQFAPNEDFGAYPRTEQSDLEKLARVGTDAVFGPSVAEMYPPGFATTVSVDGPSTGLETDFRPHFFAGVATVVSKLLLSCLPDAAIFGEKDYQQLLVVRRMVADLGLPVTIVGHPTLRETDGLAMSSRNAYLSPGERATAPRLNATLRAAAAAINAGSDAGAALATARADLVEAGFAVDYVEMRNAETLAPVANVRAEPLRLLAAARLGKTRLIDNIAV
jgi:pantoate--beta-alanine ligase